MRKVEAMQTTTLSSSPLPFMASEMMQLSSSTNRLLSDDRSDQYTAAQSIFTNRQMFDSDEAALQVPLIPWQLQGDDGEGEGNSQEPVAIMIRQEVIEGVSASPSQPDDELSHRVVGLGALLDSNTIAERAAPNEHDHQYKYQVNIFSSEPSFLSDITTSAAEYEKGECREGKEEDDDVDRYFGRWQFNTKGTAKREREGCETVHVVSHDTTEVESAISPAHMSEHKKSIDKSINDSITHKSLLTGSNRLQKSKATVPGRNRKPRNRPTVFQWEKLVDLPIPSDPRRQSVWPFWLHPAFRVESDGYHERVSVSMLSNLLRTISMEATTFMAYRSIFESVFGPIICYNRVEEMYETIRVIGSLRQDTNLMNAQLDPELQRSYLPLNTLFINDFFVPRYLGAFPSFYAFCEHDKTLKTSLPRQLYSILNERLIAWYGGAAEVEDYQLWGVARISMMESYNDRPLSVSDLSREDQADWQQRLDHCATLEDAITATEEYFGPLEQVDHYKRPKIDVRKLWNPCQCSICRRSQKRQRYDK